ncbi:NAD(P)H-dependent oxidoreductase [Streptomyces sp. 549]|uniref:NADPH-dependent FMN reductase n=1 Tax=Streptomyces sp. 549 TaxID=3049076 RepID=UPI0024C2CE6A|nr:NAD(P)H-dependent oxidoreductase [Streptomyces sp. 549]MDK1472069.1 NAD(P)H-dependent oxidoreductase [Streptomyces sp. 549]
MTAPQTRARPVSADGNGTAPIRTAVIIGSTRQGRRGDRVGGWFVERAARHDGVDLDVVDLACFDFPGHYPREATGPMAEFTSRVARAEAFVVVTPEYNRGYPASLKQAIDYAYDEWHAKPVCFVSYGHRSEGRYAVEQLRTVFTELHTVTLRNSVNVNIMDTTSDDDGPAVDCMLDQLTWWGLALREARAVRPYVA